MSVGKSQTSPHKADWNAGSWSSALQEVKIRDRKTVTASGEFVRKPSTIPLQRKDAKRSRETHFLLLGGLQVYLGLKSFTQREHQKRKTETSKSNSVAK